MPYRTLTCLVIVLALCLGGCKLPGDDVRDGLGLTSDRHENLANGWLVRVNMSVLTFTIY